MVTEDGADVQRPEKATLKRKLTGPPRLLLGKTRTRSVDDRPEAQSDQSKMSDGDESNSVGSDSEQREIANMVLSAVEVESSRGRCEAPSDDDDIRNRKVNRRRWWRRFSPAVVCYRKRKKDTEESLQRQKSYVPVPPEGALQEADITTLKSTEEDMKGTKEKRRFNMRIWPKFKGFLTSSDVRRTQEQKRDFEDKDGDGTLMTFRKKMQKIFTRGGKNRSFSVPVENMEEVMKCEEAPCSSVAHTPTELHNDVSLDQSVEVVMVAAEMSVQVVDEPEESPDQTATEEQLVCEITTDDVSRSETIQSEVAEGPTLPVQDLLEVPSPEKDILDTNDQLSTSTTSTLDDSQVQSEEKTTDESTLRRLQPSTNGPFIRIELVPPDDVTQEDEEEECWEGSPSSENHNHLLLIGFEHSERQLLQTARSLVRAAMNAAVAQLTREQQSGSECVHREPPGCRDHA